MAIQYMFKEMDKVIRESASEYHEALERQNSAVQTKVYYTEQWVKGLVVKSIFKYLNIIASMPTTHFKSIKQKATRAAVSALSSYSTVSNWERKLTTAGFKVLTGRKDFLGIPEDFDYSEQFKFKQVHVAKEPHNTIVLTFFQSYTQGQGTRYVPDKHGSAQRQVMKEVLRDALDTLAHTDTLVDSTMKSAGLGGAGAVSTRGLDYGVGSQFQRLHGGAGSNNAPLGFGNRSDTTVHLVDALQKLGEPGVAQDITAYAQEEAFMSGNGVTNTQIKSITSFLNQEFNAAYKIDGMSKIDVLGGGFEIDKNFVIKIAVGSGNQNSLMKRADAMKKGAKKGGLQGFFKSIENRLLDKFQKDPGMKTSLSMAEMVERGVFAGVAKRMKTASGMPDMRFKVNKALYNKAKYNEKTSGKNFIKIKKASKKTVKRRAEQKHVIPKPSNNAGSSFKNQDFNPLALEALLNELLPKVVASKMTSPALNYRTGRFAESAEVEEVMIGQRGGLNVNYTYQKDPYQTFEPGFARGSTYRDPRKIIGESVREIAQSMIGNKFLRVRRV
jgi:hypothetical protein